MNLPKDSGIDWLIAAGIPPEEMERVLEKEKREKDILDHYERKMAYQPLPWDSDKKLMRLKRFLVTKSKEDISTFAKWSRREYSSFTPSKARQYPELVIDLWLQAFENVERPLTNEEQIKRLVERDREKPKDEGWTYHFEDK